MRTVVIFTALICVLTLESEVLRNETAPDFFKTDYSYTELKTKPIIIDARKDIPELYDQKFLTTESNHPDSILQKINGFRIQIFKTEDISEAKKRESLYENSFGEGNVLLIFEKPFYKIRVGRLRNKEEAAEYQRVLKNKGLDASIIVPDEVEVMMPVTNLNK